MRLTQPPRCKMKHNLCDVGGFSTIEILVAVAMLSVILVVSGAAFQNLSTQTVLLNRQVVISEQKVILDTITSNAYVCGCQLDMTKNLVKASVLHVDTTVPNPPDIDLGILRTGCSFLSPAQIIDKVGGKFGRAPTTLNVTAVKVAGIQPTGQVDEYTANFSIGLQSDDGTFTRTVNSYVRLSVDSTAGTPAARPINACLQGSPPSFGPVECPAGFVFVGKPRSTAAFCIEPNQRASQPYFSAIDTCSAVHPAGYNRAKVCEARRWIVACKAGKLNSAHDFEMTSQTSVHIGSTPATSYPSVILFARSTCDDSGATIHFPTAGYFRCCL